jgi:glycosyltransferase involved in cell wall biosynthesis
MYHADLMGLISAWLTSPCRVVWNIRCSNIDMHYVSALNAGMIKLNARLSWMPTAVIVNSEAGRVHHKSLGYHPRRWAVIPNGFDLQQFKPDAHARQALRNELGIRDATPLIGLVARFDPQKDHSTFLRAAGILARREPSVHFVLAGAGVTADNGILSAVMAQEHLEGRVHLLGLRSDVARLTSALDIASSSSLSEGFPNALGEAMACGVPCVVTDAGDSAPIVGETGIVVPPRNPGALAEGWLKLIRLGAEGRHQLGLAARERIRRLYSLESVVRQYEELYLSLSSGTKV